MLRPSQGGGALFGSVVAVLQVGVGVAVGGLAGGAGPGRSLRASLAVRRVPRLLLLPALREVALSNDLQIVQIISVDFLLYH